MKLTVTNTSPLPLYRQMYDQLAAQILRGEIAPGVGRGTFAAALGETDKAAMRRAILKEKLTDAAQFCAAVGASGEEAAALLRELMKEENA